MHPPERQARVRASGFTLLEGPRWIDDQLIVSDFFTGRVLSFAAADGQLEPRTVCHVPGRPSGLGVTPEGRLWIVSQLDHRVLEFDGERLEVVADITEHCDGPANDMIITPSGTAYVGNYGLPDFADTPLRPTRLVSIASGGEVSIAAEGLMFPNGMALTPDAAELLVAETYAGRVTAFELLEQGGLGTRRTWAQFGDPAPFDSLAAAQQHFPVLPDGLAIDAAGHLWVADSKGRGIALIAEDGERLDFVSTGALAVYAAALGGADGRTLYLCCEPPVGTSDPRISTEAVLMSARVDTPGVAA